MVQYAAAKKDTIKMKSPYHPVSNPKASPSRQLLFCVYSSKCVVYTRTQNVLLNILFYLMHFKKRIHIAFIK